ncbi:hypothetical protein SLA2020_312830 [Shorea laevis]
MQSNLFTGNSGTQRRVDLGGRSPRHKDRKTYIKHVQSTRLKRQDHRLPLREEWEAAIKIQLQKCFRGFRARLEVDRSIKRKKFCQFYGKKCHNVDRNCFGPHSEFLSQFCFFFDAKNVEDLSVLVETCSKLQHFVQDGNVVSLFAAGIDQDNSLNPALVEDRVKLLSFACLRAIYIRTGRKRIKLKDGLLATPGESSLSKQTTVLFQALLLLIGPQLPWVGKVVDYLIQRDLFTLLREIILTAKESTRGHVKKKSLLEDLLARIASLVAQKPGFRPHTGTPWSFCFLSQILTVPLIWQLFPYLKEDFASPRLNQHYIDQMATYVGTELTGYVYLLGNILEIAALSLAHHDCSVEMVVELATTAAVLEALPPRESWSKEKGESRERSTLDEDEMNHHDEVTVGVLGGNLKRQINNVIDSYILQQLNKVLSKGPTMIHASEDEGPKNINLPVVADACAFLQATFNTLPSEQIVNKLASRTDLVPKLWNFVKWCYQDPNWLTFLPAQFSDLLLDAPLWLFPLAVFCTFYKYKLMMVDDKEFYEQGKPLSLYNVKYLIKMLKEALWELLWPNPTAQPNPAEFAPNSSSPKRQPVEIIQCRIVTVFSEVLAQLQDWNNKREFTSPSDFHVQMVVGNEYFISQAAIEGTKEHGIVNQAPVLIPFADREKIFTAQLAAVKQQHQQHGGGKHFIIRRDHFCEDACNQMSALSEEDLRGLIHVTFVSEFGVQEAGEGGGIFKDFMDNITRDAFGLQHGLFKETSDHLLYPNPGSRIIDDQHLQNFHILGTFLAKALYEGILVDSSFANFFLSKLKQKCNYLIDLSSFDRELCRHLISLKNYEGDISELELYFIIVNNEYGEQREEELVPGGKNLRVTKDNVFEYIYLYCNYRLNFQIQKQSSHFLGGFQKLMQKHWINMFNEKEWQRLISGSPQSLDVDNLQQHTNYTDGYNSGYCTIEMFWEVLKSFSPENKKKFLKFVTGCCQGPSRGFEYLEPLFCIQRAAGASDRLPTSATCLNLLKLPPYTSKEELEKKLLYAINESAGFELV